MTSDRLGRIKAWEWITVLDKEFDEAGEAIRTPVGSFGLADVADNGQHLSQDPRHLVSLYGWWNQP